MIESNHLKKQQQTIAVYQFLFPIVEAVTRGLKQNIKKKFKIIVL